MSGYRKLDVWNEAHKLTLDIYRVTATFPNEEKFGLISQIRRASSSIPTNIAEGQGRSNNKEFANFVRIAKGSASEVEYLIYLCYELGYLNKIQFVNLNRQIERILGMLSNLISSLYKYTKS
ncbi:four helix bundle protein [Anaerosolibacter carboniphilus]|uniref:Four helix bundle protein n=1 Tax=Anaerosolibacter carboniphilus TaxID=1417629 RepID=A0A841KWG8_9FIRM|nr:four helix bundle protein [Anaerosolibacter carboniphilus]MBB6216360.1 four helix bundle protein [Anaerosolibacter carboniphilus]